MIWDSIDFFLFSLGLLADKHVCLGDDILVTSWKIKTSKICAPQLLVRRKVQWVWRASNYRSKEAKQQRNPEIHTFFYDNQDFLFQSRFLKR